MNLHLSAFELTYILKEIDFIQDAKIEKIKSHGDRYSLEIHIPTIGKQYIYIQQPEVFCVTKEKISLPSKPNDFLMVLRKYCTGAKIQSINQYGFDRIVTLAIKRQDEVYYLIIELFHQGNLLLCDHEYKILSALQYKRWSDERAILPGKIYTFPPLKQKPNELSDTEFKEKIVSSSKKSIVQILAVDFSLGGQYSEEVLSRANIKAQEVVSNLNEEAIVIIKESIDTLFSESLSPVRINDHIYPFPLAKLQLDDARQMPSFNEAVYDIIQQRQATVSDSFPISNKEIKIQKIIESQKKQLNIIEESEKQNQKKGEWIYEQYLLLEKVWLRIKEGKAVDEKSPDGSVSILKQGKKVVVEVN